MTGKEENLKRQAKRMNQPIPDRILNKPILKKSLMLYFDAFVELQYDRNASKHVPWTVITQYADRYELSEFQTEKLIYLIHRLDECYNKWLSSKG